jgi:hypothetical protein
MRVSCSQEESTATDENSANINVMLVTMSISERSTKDKTHKIIEKLWWVHKMFQNWGGGGLLRIKSHMLNIHTLLYVKSRQNFKWNLIIYTLTTSVSQSRQTSWITLYSNLYCGFFTEKNVYQYCPKLPQHMKSLFAIFKLNFMVPQARLKIIIHSLLVLPPK